VVFEDEHLLVTHKPAGWNTHAPAPHAGEGLYDWLRHREPRWAALAIIHRLDKETSGLLVFGKSALANRSLTDQFTARTVTKTYLLLTDRPVAENSWTVETALIRAGERYLARPLAAGGERAKTQFQVVRRQGGYTWLTAHPVTGRTHQIRVHAAHTGKPILGDTLYGGTPAERVCLHAGHVRFQHPETGTETEFALEANFAHALPAPVGTPSAPRLAALRSAVIAAAETDAFRVLHGAADQESGLYLDRLGPFDLIQTDQELTATAATRWPGPGTRSTYLKRLDRYVRGATTTDTSPRWLAGEIAPERFPVRENGVTYEVSFAEGYSYGLFLDQRDNRRRLLVNHVAANFPIHPAGLAGREVLNCFAYTCAFSVSAALGGARTTSLDLSRKYLDWGRRNFALNRLDPATHDFIYGDVFDWLRRLTRKGRTFDAVLLDPPTFSRSKEHGDFRAEKDYGQLVTTALPLLAPGGVLFASTNAARLEPADFLAQIRLAITTAGRRLVQEHYVPQPPDFPIARDEPAYLKTVWLRVE
jgi:23S rRNA (cytosine1962-C5)-methyltransferase